MANSTTNNTTTNASQSGIVPTHKQTQERIGKLAVVGRALANTYSEANQDFGDDFDLALGSLKDFLVDIEAMDLPEPSKQGMRDLAKYLQGKIQKRIKGSMNVSETGYVD